MEYPIVTIVGRPNVGKSTLFNRIVRTRESIVDDMPGVTRDCKFFKTDWAGRHFIIGDTGGYMPLSDDIIEREVFKRLVSAIQGSDLVVFMVDAKTGLTALDEEISKELIKNGNTVLLTVNKVDNEQMELDASEFYKLGLGEMVTISAISGRKTGDFLDKVISFFPDSKLYEKKEKRSYVSLAIIGRPNVGKSSFVNAILGEDRQIVTDIPGTTRDSNDTIFKYYGEDFLLIDTAGLRRKAKVKDPVEFYSTVRCMQSIQRCDIAIVMIDATRGLEVQDMKIINEAVQLNKGIIVAVNKWDLIEKDTYTTKKFEDNIQDSLKNLTYIPKIFISALTKQRIYKVIELAKKVSLERSKKVSTPDLNIFLEDIIKKYPPPSMDQKEVNLNYCTQIKASPPVFVFFGNHPKSIRPNYRAYVENNFRERFGFEGVPLTFTYRKK